MYFSKVLQVQVAPLLEKSRKWFLRSKSLSVNPQIFTEFLFCLWARCQITDMQTVVLQPNPDQYMSLQIKFYCNTAMRVHYIQPMAAFLQQPATSTKTIRPIKPKTFTIRSLTENICQLPCQTRKIQKCICMLTQVVVTWVYTCIKTHQAFHSFNHV